MTARSTPPVGHDKPHVRFRFGEWWVFQRVPKAPPGSLRARYPARDGLRSLRIDRIGRGPTVTAAWHQFCAMPCYNELRG